MNSSMIGKIEKAHRYAKEPERVRLHTSRRLSRGVMTTTRSVSRMASGVARVMRFRPRVGHLRHVMAVQELLSPMLSTEDRYAGDSLAAAPALSLVN
jgi:hypothetical protein